MSTLRTLALSGLAAGSLLVVAACGSSGANGAGSGSGGNTTVSSGGGGSQGAVVSAKSGPLGTYLTNNSGQTLYLFASDKGGKVTCTGSCLTYWPPLTTTGAPRASAGVKSSLLGTAKMANGKMIVTYAGHPLYLYVGDKAPGDTNGEGSNNFGAKWWAVSMTGKAITGSGSAPSSSQTTSGGSGGGGSWG